MIVSLLRGILLDISASMRGGRSDLLAIARVAIGYWIHPNRGTSTSWSMSVT